MLLLASLLIFITGCAHSYLGERYIIMRLLKRDGLPKLFGGTEFTAGTLRFAWHITTVAWWAFALLLALASQNALSSTRVLQVIAGASVVSAALPLLFTRGKHLSWLVFLLVAALVWLAI
ncbi:hypothetical protein [Rhodoferax saidenbachensis]|uniref:DUF3325 domain-containing protein n=1 Tax=Rhodoferax saidenbachensis TaxID=1484693 RepID=A0ABU1ZR49_9BURK|nr:hypothetical protein [Rhodoferax saidenbachensis]MDR7308002.1 hypothetical protein [Rhodoferax saidenbachensis]